MGRLASEASRRSLEVVLVLTPLLPAYRKNLRGAWYGGLSFVLLVGGLLIVANESGP